MQAMGVGGPVFHGHHTSITQGLLVLNVLVQGFDGP